MTNNTDLEVENPRIRKGDYTNGNGAISNVSVSVYRGEGMKKINWMRKIINIFIWFPLVNFLPKKLLATIFIHSSGHTRSIRKNAKTHKALELMYGYKTLKFEQGHLLEGMGTHFWESNVLNAQAVRNRLVLVKQIIRKEILTLANRGEKKIRILSLASGSARAVIEVMSELKEIDTQAHFVDISRSALVYSRKLAEQCGVLERGVWTREDVRDVEKFCEGFKPHIVEVVGLMDYLEEHDAVMLGAKVHKYLTSNGTLIFSNVADNQERKFIEEVVGWNMVYRDANQLTELVLKMGFASESCEILYEPFKIHGLVVARKRLDGLF